MNTTEPVIRDERTVAVQNAAFKWGFYALYLALLLDCLYRRKVQNEDTGDLLVVLGVGVAVATIYMIRNKAAVPPLWWRKFVIVYVSILVVTVLVSILALLL